MDGQAARLSAFAFGVLGAGLVAAGVVSIATGIPHPAYNLAPLSGPVDLLRRLGEVTPLLAAGLGAVVVAWLALMLVSGRLRPATAALELIVVGLAVEVCVVGAIGRLGYAPDGTVLVAGVACVTGGASAIAAGLLAALVHE
jgi:hypothetical protein